MRHLLLTVFLLTAGCGDEPPPHRDTEGTSRAIVHGTRGPVHLDLSPSQIRAIGFLHAMDTPHIPFCTGTVVEHGIVITAGHCTSASADPSQLGFAIGEQPAAPEARFQVSQIHTHPAVDIAVLVLDGATESAGITPIPFNRQAVDERWVNDIVEVAGYGETLDADRSGRWFAAMRVDRVDPEHIVVNGDGLRGLCNGDSGAPSIGLRGDSTPIVMGVESGGEPTCVDRDFMVRVDQVKTWIDDILNHQGDQACNEIPAEGSCTDNVLQRCSVQGAASIRDCTIAGGTCLPATQTQPAACSCAEVTSLGRCNGDITESCREGRLHRTNCAALGLVCGWTPGGVFGCTDTPDCGAEASAGFCVGNTLVTCTEGQFRRVPCHGARCLVLDDQATCLSPDGRTFGRPSPADEFSGTQASCSAGRWVPLILRPRR